MRIQHNFFTFSHLANYSSCLKPFDCADRTGSGILGLVWSYSKSQLQPMLVDKVKFAFNFKTAFYAAPPSLHTKLNAHNITQHPTYHYRTAPI